MAKIILLSGIELQFSKGNGNLLSEIDTFQVPKVLESYALYLECNEDDRVIRFYLSDTFWSNINSNGNLATSNNKKYFTIFSQMMSQNKTIPNIDKLVRTIHPELEVVSNNRLHTKNNFYVLDATRVQKIFLNEYVVKEKILVTSKKDYAIPSRANRRSSSSYSDDDRNYESKSKSSSDTSSSDIEKNDLDTRFADARSSTNGCSSRSNSSSSSGSEEDFNITDVDELVISPTKKYSNRMNAKNSASSSYSDDDIERSDYILNTRIKIPTRQQINYKVKKTVSVKKKSTNTRKNRRLSPSMNDSNSYD